MNLSAEEFVNDYLVDRNLVGRTRAAKVASLLDAWIRQEFTGPHSRQVENLRRHNADLLVALEAATLIIEQVVDGINDEWTRWFSAPLLQDNEREWLEQAEEFVEQARAAARGKG